MRKFLSSLLLFVYIYYYLIISVFAATNGSVLVYAIVGNINSAPVITDMIPEWVGTWTIAVSIEYGFQDFDITLADSESDTITYTITTQYGTTDKISGQILPSEYNNNFAFTYFTPSIEIIDTITITFNDWSNVISREIFLDVYHE